MSEGLRQRLRALSGTGAIAARSRSASHRSESGPGPTGQRRAPAGGRLGLPPLAGARPGPGWAGLPRLGFRLEDGVFVRRLNAGGGTEGLQPAGASVLALLAGDLAWATVDPETVWFFDTETTGLAGGTGTVPFLYGWARQLAGRMEVEQWLLPDLGAEGPLVQRALERLASAGGVVTYNGSTFDLPLLRTRAVLEGHGRPWHPPLHLDLLPLVRRLFGHRLARCTLAEVERRLLATSRRGDLPSAEVPERYRQYLRQGDVDGLAAVLDHNEVDVVTLARLLALLGRQAGGSVQEPADHLGLGRFYEARGATSSALRTYATAVQVAPPPLDRASARHQARLLRREGRAAEAAELWRLLWERWGDLEAAEALSVDQERRLGDVEAALRVSEAALGIAPPALADRFARRIWRLERRRGRRPARPGRRSASAAPVAGTARGCVDEPPPWNVWLPGGASYEAWQVARRRGAAGRLAARPDDGARPRPDLVSLPA